MKSFLSIILAMLFVLNSSGGFYEQENGSIGLPAPDCYSVYTFINDNFDLFVEKYNEENESGEKWSAEGIEDAFPITVKSTENQQCALFLDFSKDDGYAILGDDYLMFDFQVSGESPFVCIDADELFFSVFGEYYYRIGEDYFSVDSEKNTSEEDWLNAVQGETTYDGQESGQIGCGCINDPDKFVEAKYGSGWKLDRSNSLPMGAYTQWRLSCYKQNKKGYTGGISEGNCWAVSAYHVLQYYADKKYSEMPKSTSMTPYDPISSEPQIYSKYYDKDGNNISGTFKDGGVTKYNYEMMSSDFTFMELWAKTREYTNSKYGRINGGTIWETQNIVEKVAESYNCSIKTTISYNTCAPYCFDVVDVIKRGDVFLLSTQNGTYGSHTMAGCGYRVYKKTRSIWFISWTVEALLLEIRDGWFDSPRYYDITGFSGMGALIYCQAITKPSSQQRPGRTNEVN